MNYHHISPQNIIRQGFIIMGFLFWIVFGSVAIGQADDPEAVRGTSQTKPLSLTIKNL